MKWLQVLLFNTIWTLSIHYLTLSIYYLTLFEQYPFISAQLMAASIALYHSQFNLVSVIYLHKI